MPNPIINRVALEPLYNSWEQPNAHRIRAEKAGGPAKVIKGRRSSGITIAHNLRSAVSEWRESGYFGASNTTRTLFEHWFERTHLTTTAAGDEFQFRYYFCQREAMWRFF